MPHPSCATSLSWDLVQMVRKLQRPLLEDSMGNGDERGEYERGAQMALPAKDNLDLATLLPKGLPLFSLLP